MQILLPQTETLRVFSPSLLFQICTALQRRPSFSLETRNLTAWWEALQALYAKAPQREEDKNIWGADSQGTNSIFMPKLTKKQADIDSMSRAQAQRRSVSLNPGRDSLTSNSQV
jgi:hypothetical protein